MHRFPFLKPWNMQNSFQTLLMMFIVQCVSVYKIYSLYDGSVYRYSALSGPVYIIYIYQKWMRRAFLTKTTVCVCVCACVKYTKESEIFNVQHCTVYSVHRTHKRQQTKFHKIVTCNLFLYKTCQKAKLSYSFCLVFLFIPMSNASFHIA